MVAALLLGLAGWLVYRAYVFIEQAERRQIELQQSDEIWREIVDAGARSRMD